MGKATDITDISELLGNLPLFAQLMDEEIQQLATTTRRITLSRGQLLFQKGTLLDGFYIVLSGQIKLAFSSPQGNEKVVSIVGVGQSFGEAIMFMEKPSPVLAQGLEDCDLLCINKYSLFAAIERDNAFSRRMLAGLSMRLHGLIRDVEGYSLHSSIQRVIGFLLQLAGSITYGHVLLELPASKHIIASRLNLAPETFSRVLHTLSEAGLIHVSGKNITIFEMTCLSQFDSVPIPNCTSNCKHYCASPLNLTQRSTVAVILE